MFERIKNEDGSFALRPMYIGTIKNNFIRRTLCLLTVPITFTLVTITNLLVLHLWVVVKLLQLVWDYVGGFFNSIYKPLVGVLKFGEIWKRPREK